jgi:hypothetical protein
MTTLIKLNDLAPSEIVTVNGIDAIIKINSIEWVGLALTEIYYIPENDYPEAASGNVSMLQIPSGSADYITVPNHISLNPTGAITIEWRGIIDANTSATHVLVEKPHTSHTAPYYQYLLAYRTDDKIIRFDLAVAGTRRVIISDPQLEILAGQRLHIVARYDGSSMRLYLNGRLVKQDSWSGSISAYDTPLWFGRHQNVTTETADATYDEVRIWSTARTQAEIVLNMERQLIGDEEGLEGLWLFNEDTGISVDDSTSNSNDGTISGSSYTWNSTTFTWDGVNDEKWHIPCKLNLTTYDGSGNSVHPSVVYIPDGLSGYNWWMGVTPYPVSGNNAYENPSILASNDGVEWVVPNGVTNPLVPGDEGVIFNSDSNLLAIDNDGVTELWYYYRETIISSNSIDINLIKSVDGINWDEPITVVPDDDDTPISQAVYYNGNQFIMIAIDFDVAILRWTSPDGVVWTPAAAGAISGMPVDRFAWHMDILYDTEIDRLHIFMATSTGDGGAGSRMSYAYSDDDGENITIVNYVTEDLTAIEASLQYQGSMVLDPDYKDRYWMFGSVFGGPNGSWYTTLITRRLPSGDLYQENI